VQQPERPRHQLFGDGSARRWQFALILATSLAGAALVLFALVELARPLALVFVAIILGQALSPPVTWLSRWIPRGIAIVLVYLVLLSIAAVGFWLVIPPLYVQAEQFAATVPHLVEQGRGYINHLAPVAGSEVTNHLKSQAVDLARSLVSLPLSVASGLFQALIVLFLSIYWLVSAPGIERFILSLAPDEYTDRTRSVIDEVGGMLGAYVRGEVFTALIVGIVSYLGMTVIGVHYALVIGLIAFLGNLVPLIGASIVEAIATAIALFQSPVDAAITLAFFLVLEQLAGTVLLPAVTGGVARIPALAIIFGLLAGGMVAGILGALIAVPLVEALRIVIVRVAAPILRDWWGARTTS